MNSVAQLVPSLYAKAKQEGFDMRPAHMEFNLPDPLIHRCVLRILLAGAKRSLSYAEVKRLRVVLRFLVCMFFHLDETIISECEEARDCRLFDLLGE